MNDARAARQAAVPGRAMALVAAFAGGWSGGLKLHVYAFASLYFADVFFPTGFVLQPVCGWVSSCVANKCGPRSAMLVSLVITWGSPLVFCRLIAHVQKAPPGGAVRWCLYPGVAWVIAYAMPLWSARNI
jgi:hypothetical protein